ncbi:hypothetical protein BT63DRAFT_412536 [Microthyrium microscopicum]|uniref:C2H2-type domain-containing protein n=1 Tax=Microthyrium microscopicum TaxID=703497 RepID=A0A6A6UKV3_9PEZI|nr:hypothetical protein BT63DRAFT_412536 [Microthyrium microscopicum]
MSPQQLRVEEYSSIYFSDSEDLWPITIFNSRADWNWRSHGGKQLEKPSTCHYNFNVLSTELAANVETTSLDLLEPLPNQHDDVELRGLSFLDAALDAPWDGELLQWVLPLDASPVEDSLVMETRAVSVAPSEATSTGSEGPGSSDLLTSTFNHAGPLAAKHSCAKCKEAFARALDLEEHAKTTKHKPFACSNCNTCFSRQDALTRHREVHGSPKLYPCPECEKYRGDASFRRRDHLRQHLRKKHRVHPSTEFPRYCSYECCTFSKRHWQEGFALRRDYSKHMRTVHGKERHDCSVEDCDRVGNRGFARLSDLIKHKKNVHGELC